MTHYVGVPKMARELATNVGERWLVGEHVIIHTGYSVKWIHEFRFGIQKLVLDPLGPVLSRPEFDYGDLNNSKLVVCSLYIDTSKLHCTSEIH